MPDNVAATQSRDKPLQGNNTAGIQLMLDKGLVNKANGEPNASIKVSSKDKKVLKRFTSQKIKLSGVSADKPVADLTKAEVHYIAADQYTAKVKDSVVSNNIQKKKTEVKKGIENAKQTIDSIPKQIKQTSDQRIAAMVESYQSPNQKQTPAAVQIDTQIDATLTSMEKLAQQTTVIAQESDRLHRDVQVAQPTDNDRVLMGKFTEETGKSLGAQGQGSKH